MVYDESFELDENELNKIIEKGIVSDAITVYNLLNKNGTGNFINFVSILDKQKICLLILISITFRYMFRYTTSSFRVGLFL